MKRLVFFLLLIGALVGSSAAVADQTALYTALTEKSTILRQRAERSAKKIVTVPEKETVHIFAYDEGWCYCSYGNHVGYIKTDALSSFAPIGETAIPWYQRTSGLAVMNAEVSVTQGKHIADLNAGDRVALMDASGTAPMMRETTQLPDGDYRYYPFIDPKDAQQGDLLYAFTTWYPKGLGGSLEANRLHNISLAAGWITGTVLQPGEEFSFNRFCAPYNRGKGYRDAPNISRSGHGNGGGVCQVSTTLYQTILGLHLQVNEWYVHRASGIAYAPVSLDCAVSTYHDFRFVNSLDLPIEISILAQKNTVTVMITAAS